jgi:hypothetical protein
MRWQSASVLFVCCTRCRRVCGVKYPRIVRRPEGLQIGYQASRRRRGGGGILVSNGGSTRAGKSEGSFPKVRCVDLYRPASPAQKLYFSPTTTAKKKTLPLLLPFFFSRHPSTRTCPRRRRRVMSSVGRCMYLTMAQAVQVGRQRATRPCSRSRVTILPDC